MNPVITALSVLPISAAFLRRLFPRCSHDSSSPSDAARLLTARLLAIVVAARESRTYTLFYLEITWSLFIADSVERQRAPSDAFISAVCTITRSSYSRLFFYHDYLDYLSAREIIIWPNDHFILCLILANNEDAMIHCVTLCVFLNWKGRRGPFIIVLYISYSTSHSFDQTSIKEERALKNIECLYRLFIYF